MPKYMFEVEEKITKCMYCTCRDMRYNECKIAKRNLYTNELFQVKPDWCPLQLVDDNAKEVEDNE